MREWIKLIEDYQRIGKNIGTQNWRDQTMELSIDPEQTVFSLITPKESGLPYSVFISGWEKCPAIIIDFFIGKHLEPDPKTSKVYVIGEHTGNSLVDEWISINIQILKDHAEGNIDTMEFGQKLRKNSLAKLEEMANFARGKFNVPASIWVRAEPNPLQHSARVKVNANYKTKFDPNENFSVALFPSAHMVQDKGNLSNKDANGIVAWIDKNKNAFWDFICEKIDREQLESLLSSNPYP